MLKPILLQLIFGVLILTGCSSSSTPPDEYFFGCTNNCDDMCTPGTCCMETCESGPRYIECSAPDDTYGAPACPNRIPDEGAACACMIRRATLLVPFEGERVPSCEYRGLGGCTITAYCVQDTWRIRQICEQDGATDAGQDAAADADAQDAAVDANSDAESDALTGSG